MLVLFWLLLPSKQLSSNWLHTQTEGFEISRMNSVLAVSAACLT